MHIAFLNPQGNFDAADSHWTEHPDFGGQLVYVKEVALALARQEIKVDILTRRVIDPNWPQFGDEIDHYDTEQSGLRIVRIACGGDRFLDKEWLWPHLDDWVAGILGFYADALPDFFTGHYADGGYAGALIKYRTGIGFTFTGHSLGAQKLDKLGMNPGNASELEERFHFAQRIAAERISMREAHRVITSTVQERTEQYGHPLYEGAIDTGDDTRFATAPPGVNQRIFGPDPGPMDDTIAASLSARLDSLELPRIVVSSRLDEKKNILGTVRAYCGSENLRQCSRLAVYIRGVDDPFAEGGKIPASERAVLAPILELIARSGARGLVDFVNVDSQHALAASYRFFAKRGSVFVLSSFYEPFGLAPIEAGACGLAVVATANGGPTEIFADGSGVLVGPQDSEAIARGIAHALAEHRTLAARIRDRVESSYTWSKTAEDYLAVIETGCKTTSTPQRMTTALDASERLRAYLKSVSAA